MMKKLLCTMLTVFMLLHLSFPVSAAEPYTDAAHFSAMGTTPSNLRLDGRVASDGEFAYYSVFEDGIYRTSLSGGGSTKIVSPSTLGAASSDSCDFLFLNAAEGVLYFYYNGYGKAGGIYACRQDGGVSCILACNRIHYLGISDGRLVYSQSGEDIGASDHGSGEYGFAEIPTYSMNTFYEMNLDGTGRHPLGAVIPVSSSWDLLVADGRICYVDVTNRDMPFYSVKLDGTDKTLLSAGYTHYGEGPRYTYGGYIYFRESSIDTMADGTRVIGSSSACYRVKPDGTGKETIVFPENVQVSFVNAMDGRCYAATGEGIVWVEPDSGQSGSIGFGIERLESTGMLYTVPGWIYFTVSVYPADYVKPTAPGSYTFSLDSVLCRVRLDGSGFEEVHRRQGASSFTQTIFY